MEFVLGGARVQRVEPAVVADNDTAATSRASRPKRKRESQGRHWCFTLNNYTEDDLMFMVALGQAANDETRRELDYFIVGVEIAPQTGTPHLQGYMVTTKRLYFSAAKRLLGGERLHVEGAKGSSAQNREYCSKDHEFYEFGKLPEDPATKGGRKRKERLEQAWFCAIERRYDEIDKDISIPYWRQLQAIGAHYGSAVGTLQTLCNYWIYGPSGCGKSTLLRAFDPSQVYRKCEGKWWDHYSSQPIISIDDCDYHFFKASGARAIKLWFDHYPFHAETKGGTLVIRPKVAIFTSNYSLDECINWMPQEDQSAIKRRIKVVHHLGNLPGHPDPVRIIEHFRSDPIYANIMSAIK